MSVMSSAGALVQNTGAFIVVLGLMIFFHEFGHFITAKAFGMRVYIFSFGFGRRLLGFKWGETDLRVSLIPLGGYVKLEGEADDRLSEDTSALGDGKDFTGRPRWQRFIVYLAGPVMNVVLTISVLTVLYMNGFQVEASLYDRPIIGSVDAGSPAAGAGLQPGDEIVAIDGKPIATWESAEYAVMLRPDAALRVRIRRGGQEQEVALRSTSTSSDKVGTIGVHPLVRVGQVLPGKPAAQAGLRENDAILAINDKPIRSFNEIPVIVGVAAGKTLVLRVWRDGSTLEVPIVPRDDGEGPRIGIGPRYVLQKFGFSRAVVEASRWTWGMTKLTFETLERLLTAQISPKTMMGPLQIAKASGDAARVGPGPLFYLVAVISLQIGIMNLFPLPPLDGGHLAILAFESLLRRDFSITVKAWLMNAGAMALFLLLGLVVYFDLSKTSLLGKYLP
jgi:regulator of sigma E protease